VIAPAFGREARAALEGAGADVAWLETPHPHGVDPQWLPALRSLVARAIA
jgi:hypothetical protein